MDILSYNRRAWDKEVERGNRWTQAVDADTIAKARQGQWEIVLTPQIPVPKHWFPDTMQGANILCLACGGGQQASVLAATGAKITLLDNSPSQLDQDRTVAAREGLQMTFILGDMADLSMLEDESFDLIFNPCSNTFAPDLAPVWRECARVLKPGAEMLTGMCNPALFIFDDFALQKGEYVVKHSLPYADTDLPEAQRKIYTDQLEPMHFSHMLGTQIGEQARAGLAIVDLFEDYNHNQPLDKFMPCYFATRSRKI